VNDNFGHFEGDRMLRIFAQNVKNACREYDYVARMGGDEFVIVVPNITPAAAQEKTAMFNAIAIEAGVEVCGRQQISLSVGVAVFRTMVRMRSNSWPMPTTECTLPSAFTTRKRRQRPRQQGRPPVGRDSGQLVDA